MNLLINLNEKNRGKDNLKLPGSGAGVLMHTNTTDNVCANVQLASYLSKKEGQDVPVTDGGEVALAKQKLQSWINKHMKIEMTDGRILIGMFLCTDRDGNVILGSCSEYLNPEVCGFTDEPRLLGLVMVPGRHIVAIHFDDQAAQAHITNHSADDGKFN